MADKEAAVAIVHARATDAVLLMRRAERAEDPWSGHWSFPGGRRDPEDADLLHTALRELEEECGIRLAREQMEAALSPAMARRRVGPVLTVAPFLFRVDEEPSLILDPAEAADARWIPLGELRDRTRHVLCNVPGFPPEIRFPGIDLDGVPLWGFTYRLISEWLELRSPDDHAAQELLDCLIANGCVLEHGWVDQDGAKVAAVRGVIPPELVWAHASPWVNMLEVWPDHIRMVGLGFEEYVIRCGEGGNMQ